MTKKALGQIDDLEQLLLQSVVDERIQPDVFRELLLGTEKLYTVLGLDMELGYSDSFDSLPDMVEYTLRTGVVEQFSLYIDQVDVEEARGTLDALRDGVDEAGEDTIHDICGWLCELALLANEYGMSDDDIAKLYTEVFTEVVDEFDGPAISDELE